MDNRIGKVFMEKERKIKKELRKVTFAEEVKYLAIGGYAVSIRGYPGST